MSFLLHNEKWYAWGKAECNIIFQSAIIMILYKAKCDIYFIIYLLCYLWSYLSKQGLDNFEKMWNCDRNSTHMKNKCFGCMALGWSPVHIVPSGGGSCMSTSGHLCIYQGILLLLYRLNHSYQLFGVEWLWMCLVSMILKQISLW